jgi:hypothetical protein
MRNELRVGRTEFHLEVGMCTYLLPRLDLLYSFSPFGFILDAVRTIM